MANLIKITITFERKSKGIPFHTPSDTHFEHLLAEYVDSGKIIAKQVNISKNKLTRAVVNVFASAEEYAAYSADSTIVRGLTERDAYCRDNGISVTRLVEELDESQAVVQSTLTVVVAEDA
jgi:hypothetical protein